MTSESNWSDKKKWLMGIISALIVAAVIALFGYLWAGKENGSQAPTSEVDISARSLDADTRWDFPQRVVRLKGMILTNGNSLEIRALKLVSLGASIVAFQEPTTVGEAASGATGNRGRNGSTAGAHGEPGESGETGEFGESGKSSRVVDITVDQFEGSLKIDASGEPGGSGGRGGDGGMGGDGARGGTSRSGVFDCSSGPGSGGNGGDGGAAGAGGDGGSGGAGGDVLLTVTNRFSGSVEVISRSGKGGSGGAPGSPGRRGAGAAEGAAVGNCDPAGRDGLPGNDGALARAGASGKTSADGQIVVSLPGLNTERIGEFRYEGRMASGPQL